MRVVKFGEGKQAADRIERRQRRPWPGQDHDDIGEHQRRQQSATTNSTAKRHRARPWLEPGRGR